MKLQETNPICQTVDVNKGKTQRIKTDGEVYHVLGWKNEYLENDPLSKQCN